MDIQRPTSVQVKPKETTVEEVLADAKSTDFADEEARKKFESTHRLRLCKQPQRIHYLRQDEVLHAVSKEKSITGYESFIKWAVKEHRQLLECKNRGSDTPLHLNIMERRNEFVSLVLDQVERVDALLESQTDREETCLHYAIEHRSLFTEEIIIKAQEAGSKTKSGLGSIKPETTDVQLDVFTIKDRELMTPLHMAATSVLVHPSDKEDFRSISTTTAKLQRSSKKATFNDSMVDSAGSETQSPITMSNNIKEKLDKRLNQSNIKARRGLSLEIPGETPSPKQAQEPKKTQTPLKGAREFDLMTIVKKLIDANPRVLLEKDNDDSRTPFQARLAFLQREDSGDLTAAEAEAQRHEIIDSDPILTYMRSYIVPNFSRRDAMTALYEIGDERALEFDLSGLPYTTINAEFLNGLGKVLVFEGLLKYVALPRLTVEDDKDVGLESPKEQADADKARKAKGKGLRHMCAIFQWLKQCGVKSVLDVTVIDDVEPSHSDEAIEACVNGLDVRVWNWYKADLCCDVLLKSAARVKDVTLYSSGNNAIMAGWLSSEGLAKLDELETVHICVQEGLESPQRLAGYMTAFKTELKKKKPDVDFSWKPHKPDANYSSVFTGRGAEKAMESKWMKAMKTFADFLKTAKPDQPVKPVKIAVIDDGINMALDIFTNRVQMGESFHRLGALSGRQRAYYVPSGSHGTLMAQLICEVCPTVKLYIAQLEVLPGLDNRRSFTAESATDAITWAVSQKVDIISMSWSMAGSGVLERLQKAIRAALDENIILFCASTDDGANAIDMTYPGKSRDCIKIGASTGAGAKLSWVSEENSDFFLPGDALRPDSEASLRSHHPQGSFGSSISTALAAGLAGVLLYCDRMLATSGGAAHARGQAHTEEVVLSPGGTKKNKQESVEFFRNLAKMRDAFSTLSRGSAKFVQVWDHLPTGTLKWNSKSYPDETEETRKKVEVFMNFVKKIY